MTDWYYIKDGSDEKQGPVDTPVLKELAASGQLQPEDMLWKEGMEQWVLASRAKGLFAAPSKPEPVPSPAPAVVPPPLPVRSIYEEESPPPEKPVKWPKIFGIIATAYGGIILLTNIAQIVQKPDPDIVRMFESWVVDHIQTEAKLLLITGSLLVLLGILLLLKKPIAKYVVYAYAAASISITIFSLRVISQMLDAIKPSNNLSPSEMQVVKMSMQAAMAMPIAIGLGAPGFLIYWFLRKSTKEEIASWS